MSSSSGSRAAAAPRVAMPTTPAEDLWEKVALSLSSSKSKLAVGPRQQKRLDVLVEVREAVNESQLGYQDKGWRWKNSEGEDIKVRKFFDSILTWVEKFIVVGDTVMQYDPGHAALPWAAVRMVLQVAINDSQTFSAMLEGVELASSTITRYTIVEKLYLQRDSAVKGDLTQAIITLYNAVLEYLLKAEKYYQQSTQKRVAKSVIRTAKGEVQQYVDKIIKAQVVVNSYTELADTEYTLQTKDGVQSLQDDMHTISTSQKKLEALLANLDKPVLQMTSLVQDLHYSLEEAGRTKIFEWLSTGSYQSYHKSKVKHLMFQSGTWLLEKDEFVKWRDLDNSSIFWLHGILGSGKSFLVSSVIEELKQQTCEKSQRLPVAYFYCARVAAEPERAMPDEILRSLLEQLATTDKTSEIRYPVVKAYKEKKNEAEGRTPQRLDLEETIDIILALLETNGAFIVIDGLDECDSRRRQDLLLAMQRLVQESKRLVKVFISSRDDNDIISSLKTCPNVSISATDNSKDIRRFIDTYVEKAIQEKRLLCGNVSDELKLQIIKTLSEKASGMFRLVSLHIQSLCDPAKIKNEANVHHALGLLPQELNQMYDIILSQISTSCEPNPEVASRVLMWLMSAQRPLKAGEFIASVAVNSEGDCIPWDTAGILSICCNFVVYDDEQDVFRFAHLSVQEYLEKRQQYNDLATHSLALERCLHVIGEPAQSDTTSSALTVSLNQAFRPYASLYWPMHLQRIEGRGMDDNLTQKLFHFLFETSSASQAFENWSSTIDELSDTLQWNDQLKSRLQNVGCGPPNPIFLACAFGFLTILRRQSTFSRMDWNVKNWQGNTGLHLCARFGQISCLELLLGNGANVHARTGEMETALYWSVKSVPEEVYVPPMLVPGKWVGRSLEERKATASKIYGWSPLHKAAYHGQTAAVRLLVEKGADIEAKDGYHGATPLHWAVTVGNEVMVTLLLDLGADVSAADDEDEWTPLHRASDKGHAAIVGLLLERHAAIDSETRRRSFWTAHRLATDKGQAATMGLLMRNNALMDCTTRCKSWTALHLAADKGHEHVVRLLLEKGAKINVETYSPSGHDETRETPLDLAVKGGHQAVVQLLQSVPII